MAQIASVANVQDGVHVDATLSGAAVGSLAFRASRTQGAAGSTVPSALQSGLVYRLDLSSLIPATVLGAAVPIWVTATDTNGMSVQTPCWVRYGTSLDLSNEIIRALQALLVANKPLLDLRLQQNAPSGANANLAKLAVVQQILNGSYEAAAFPSLTINIPSENYGIFELFPLTDVVRPTIVIEAFSFHQGDRTQKPMIQALGRAIRDFFAQTQYVTYVLPSGLSLTALHVDSLTFAEIMVAEGRFQTVAECILTAELNYPYS